MKGILTLFICVIFSCRMLSAQESLIPMPREVRKEEGVLDLKQGVHLVRAGSVPDHEYRLAGEILQEWGISRQEGSGHFLKLELVNGDDDSSREAYQMKIDASGITVSATSATGLFYGLQTLRQLPVTDGRLPFCEIDDKPAFSWRGFFLGGGRKFFPLGVLQKQKEEMGRG